MTAKVLLPYASHIERMSQLRLATGFISCLAMAMVHATLSRHLSTKWVFELELIGFILASLAYVRYFKAVKERRDRDWLPVPRPSTPAS